MSLQISFIPSVILSSSLFSLFSLFLSPLTFLPFKKQKTSALTPKGRLPVNPIAPRRAVPHPPNPGFMSKWTWETSKKPFRSPALLQLRSRNRTKSGDKAVKKKQRSRPKRWPQRLLRSSRPRGQRVKQGWWLPPNPEKNRNTFLQKHFFIQT